MRKAIDLLAKIQIAVGALFLFIFMMTVVIQMACRYTGVAATWTEDVSMYSFIWAVFMGAGAMVHEKRHFAFTSISDMLKEGTVKRLLSIIICIIMLIFAFLMLKYGIAVTKQFWNYTWNNIPSFKRGPTWLCLPICGATSCIYLIEEIIDSVLALGKGGNN
ncbi:MAG: TRAP transporter small permease subunit [Clostridiales bacterium]|nr:TRAP transporter small permease subunit [Clostridiales bacterium]